MLNEAQIIHQLHSAFPNQIGDDAAVIPFSSTERYIISKDLLIESVHFNCDYCDPISLATKCLHVNLSDLAAMGARPQYILLGLSIPDHYETTLPIFLNAFTTACQEAQVELIGGDTTRSTEQLLISITAIGIAQAQLIKYRSGAQDSDILCVAGPLGYAHLGFQAFETATTGLDCFKNSFLNPRARVAEGIWLAKYPEVTAMMDLSDGLLIDLERLCTHSQVTGIIHCETLPRSEAFDSACQTLNTDPLNTQLTGGEDYSLLLTVKPNDFASLSADFQQEFGYALSPIGEIQTENITSCRPSISRGLSAGSRYIQTSLDPADKPQDVDSLELRDVVERKQLVPVSNVVLMQHNKIISQEPFHPFSHFGELS